MNKVYKIAERSRFQKNASLTSINFHIRFEIYTDENRRISDSDIHASRIWEEDVGILTWI